MQGADALERATRVKIVIFDKTGTLTKGKPTVTDTRIFLKGDLIRWLQFALALTKLYWHRDALTDIALWSYDHALNDCVSCIGHVTRIYKAITCHRAETL